MHTSFFSLILAGVFLLCSSIEAKANELSKDPILPLAVDCSLAFPHAIRVNQYTIRIPIRWLGRLPTVEARIDSVNGTFIFDTGAERLLLNRNYFTGDQKAYGADYYGVTGKSKDVFNKDIDTLFWHNLLLSNLRAHVLDLSHIEEKKKSKIVGVLGFDVFKDYEILLDFPFKQIVLTKLDNEGNRLDSAAFADAPFEVLPFNLSKHGIMLEASVNDRLLNFNLDTGAEINLLDRKVNKRVLKEFEVLKRVNLAGAGQKKIEVLAGMLSNVKCGSQRNTPMRTLLTSLDELSLLMGTKVDGVLGFEFLRPRRTLINYKKRQVSFFRLVSP